MNVTNAPLRNVGNAAPTVTDFDAWPNPNEFLRGGGMPGVEYLYVLPEEQPKAQNDPKGRWYPIVGVPFFTVRGVHLTMMARGKPVVGARPGSSICKFSRSKEAMKRVDEMVVVAPPEKPTPKVAAKDTR